MNFNELCNFEPRQKEALKMVLEKRYVLYGGAAGGGKSYFLRWLAVALLMKWAAEGHRGVRVGLFCMDYPSLRDRQVSKIQMEFPPWLGKLDKVNNEYRLKPEYGGGIIALRNLDDPSKYLSAEFAAILIDELTEHKKEVFSFLNMRLRWTGIEDTKFVGASNPGSVGHGWVKRLWIDRDFREETVTKTYSPETFGYVRALYSDNPHLAQNYGDILSSLPENLRRAYRDGDWDVFEGQFFTEFRRDAHVRPMFDRGDKETMNWFNSYPTLCGLDYGYSKPSCVLFGKYIDDTWYVFDEIYKERLTYEMLKDEIIMHEQPSMVYADPSIWAKKDDPRSGADKMKPLNLQRAYNERVIGWNFLKTLFIQNRIVIMEGCQHLIRTLPVQVYDANKVEDCDTDGEDHACLVGDTIVQIYGKGEVLLGDIDIGDYIFTPYGWQKVTEKRNVGVRPCIRIRTKNGNSMKGTPEHKVLTKKGWKRLDALRYSDILCTSIHHSSIWKKLISLWCIKAKDSTGMESIINRPLQKGVRFDCIDISGNKKWVKYPKDVISTMWTSMQRIMTGVISSVSPSPSTEPSTMLTTSRTQSLQRGIMTIWKRFGHWLQPGIKVMKDVWYIVVLRRKDGKEDHSLNQSALSVGKFLSQKIARESIAEVHAKHEKDEKNLVSHIEDGGNREVWDITVEDVGCFYANGVITSNCDALRYLVASKRHIKIQDKSLTYRGGKGLITTESDLSDLFEKPHQEPFHVSYK